VESVEPFFSGAHLGRKPKKSAKSSNSKVPYPRQSASTAEIVRYFTVGRTAVLAQGFLLALAAISLLVFSASVAAFARRTAGEGHALPGLTLGGGVLKLFAGPTTLPLTMAAHKETR
jgi:hypothetical protein